jgi:hypothetical protein
MFSLGLFHICVKLVGLIRVCSNETCSKVQTGKHLPFLFLYKVVSNKEILYHHCFSTLLTCICEMVPIFCTFSIQFG